MQTFNLPQYANQTIDLVTANGIITVDLRYFRSLTYATITFEDGTNAIANVRCCDKEWLIPYERFSSVGNLRFEDDEGEYPVYSRFGDHCLLRFYTNEEISGGV